jgi:hypothetical protein
MCKRRGAEGSRKEGKRRKRVGGMEEGQLLCYLRSWFSSQLVLSASYNALGSTLKWLVNYTPLWFT